MVTTDILDLKSWELFKSLLSTCGTSKGRMLIISNTDIPELCQSSSTNESSIRDSEFGKIEGFVINLEFNAISISNVGTAEDSAMVNSVVLPPTIVIIDLLKLSHERLLQLTNYFSQISVPVILYSGNFQSRINPHILLKVSCYCYLTINSTKNVSVFEILKQYFQPKLTSITTPKLSKVFIARSFFEKVASKWRDVVYGMQIKKRKKKVRSWKTRTVKRHNEFNKKKP